MLEVIIFTKIFSLPARCIVKAQPLDLVFILDSSGSLRNKFQDEVDVIRRIIKHVSIGETATRVMLIQFSGVQHLEFNFNKFKSREEVLSVLDVLRHVSGITRVGSAFEYTLNVLNEQNGMRPSNVPKIVFLLSDGRTHDSPKDIEMAEQLRRKVVNLDIRAYGTGEYVALSELIEITKTPDKIVTNQNLDELESMFDQWRGTEICENQPVCVRGSDKPLDLVLVIDSSESVSRLFDEQIQFAIERIIQNVNIHPDAVRLALITYSGHAYVHFKFNDRQVNNNSAVIRHLNSLRSIKGTTSTHLALYEANELFTDPEGQAREGVQKMVIVMTDGHSQRSPRDLAMRLRSQGVEIIAITMMRPPYADETELLGIAQGPERVFTPDNIQNFEAEFVRFVGFDCPGVKLGPNPQPRVRGATDVTCDENSVTFTVRTQKPMTGLMYAQQHFHDSRCVRVTNGTSRETSVTFYKDTCGLVQTPSVKRDGFSYNITVILQFHPIIITRADQGLSISCFHQQRLSPQEIGRPNVKKLSDVECTYRLHRFAADQCVALDAKVGESLYHKWECDAPPNYAYLVHDCYVKSETRNVQILDSNGCEIDPHFLETPDYSKFFEKPRKDESTEYVSEEMSVFKFPGEGNVAFKCRISLCDMESDDSCTKMIPPRCSSTSPKQRIRRDNHSARKTGFALTLDVETRTLNVLENESIRPPVAVKYCDIRV